VKRCNVCRRGNCLVEWYGFLEGLNLICFFSRFVPTTEVSFGQSESFVFTPVVSVNAE